MTKHLLRIQAALRAQLLERGVPLQRPLPPAARDGFAVLWLWDQAGSPIHRITPEMAVAAKAGLPIGLELARAPVRAAAVAYQLEARREWIVLGRIAARVPVPVQDEHCLGYAEPMLLYLTEAADLWASGCMNLGHSPTPRQLTIAPGRQYSELWSTPLAKSDIEPEMLRLAQVLPHYYYQ
jgi:hypothetical protein